MLSVFPHLLVYSFVTPFLIRLTLAAVFLHSSSKNLKAQGYRKALGIVELIGSLLLIIGLFTQVVALVFGLILLFLIAKNIKHKAFLTDGVNYYLILFILCLTLLFTGAGYYAIDLPL